MQAKRSAAAPSKAMAQELPEDLRFAVHLADVNGFSCTVIAQITGTSAVTVSTRLRDARRSLRHRLSPVPERRP